MAAGSLAAVPGTTPEPSPPSRGDLGWPLIELTSEAWMADAACHEHPEVNWFPTRGQSAEPARRVCATCLVREECLDYAVRQGSLARGVKLAGVWGGTTLPERRRFYRRPLAERPRMLIASPGWDGAEHESTGYAPAATTAAGWDGRPGRSPAPQVVDGYLRHSWADSTYFRPQSGGTQGGNGA